MDGGANCWIFEREEHFLILYRKEIKCNLANGERSRFQGVGIGVGELAPGVFVLLAPAYLSERDNVNTCSPGALVRYSGCTEAVHSAMHSFRVTFKGKKYSLPIKTVAGLDYATIKIHHFKRPIKTKYERNAYLKVRPKFVFAGSNSQMPDQDTMELTRAQQRCWTPAERSQNQEASQVATHSSSTMATTNDQLQNNNNEHSKSRPTNISKSKNNSRRMITRSMSKKSTSASACQENSVQVASIKTNSTQKDDLNPNFLCAEDPLVAALKVKTRASDANARLALYLHLKFGHQNMDYIRKTRDIGHRTNQSTS